MLTDRTIREINEQIQSEVRGARMAFNHAEKLECYERISALTAALDPQPTRQQILTELAEAIAVAQKAPKHRDARPVDLIADLIANFRR